MSIIGCVLNKYNTLQDFKFNKEIVTYKIEAIKNKKLLTKTMTINFKLSKIVIIIHAYMFI